MPPGRGAPSYRCAVSKRAAVATGAGAALGFGVFKTLAITDQLPVALAIGILIPALCLRGRARLAAVAALIGTWVLAIVLMTEIPDRLHPVPPVSEAVGWSAFYLRPYGAYQLAALAAAGAVVVAGIAIALWRRRRRAVEVTSPAAPPAPPAGSPWIVIATAAVLALALLPDLRDVFADAPGNYKGVATFVTPWDSANLTAWANFTERGLVPMRDFFYPYGYQWTFDLVPVGPLLQWLAQGAQVALIGWSLWRLFDRRAWRVALCLIAIPLIGLLPDTSIWRFLPGLTVAVVFAALGPFPRTGLGREHLIFAAALALAAYYGVDILGYGLAGVAMVVVGDAVRGEIAWRPRALTRGLAVDLAPVLAVVGALVLSWVAAGALGGNVRFFWDDVLRGSGAYSNQTFGPLSRVSLLRIESILVVLPALFLAAGMITALPLGGRRGDRATTVLLMAAGGFSILLLNKAILRWVGNELIAIPLVVLLWIAIRSWDPRRLAPTVAIAALAVALPVTAELMKPGSLSGYAGDVAGSPASAVSSLRGLANLDQLRGEAAARFDRSRFVGFPDASAAALFLGVAGPGPVPSFATIDDAQLMYSFFGQNPPYQVEPYDTSSIDEQHEVVDRLRAERPDYAVWLRDWLIQDGVPYEVRAPLVYAEFASNYGPAASSVTVPATDGGPSSEITILRRLKPGQAPKFNFWRDQLGDDMDLGWIPALSDGDELPECDGGPDCVPYAIVTGSPDAPNEQLTMNVRGPDGRQVAVRMETAPGERSYAVRLDHLWFWPFVGPRPEVSADTPGFEAEVRMVEAGDRLY